MDKMRRPKTTSICRRHFFSSIGGLTVGLLLDHSVFLKIPAGEPEFVVVNRWVLTREDVTASTVTVDAVRLQ
jgi:hypothetical protein